MATTRLVAVRLPTKLLEEIERQVGERGRSRFILEAAARELQRLRQKKAAETAFGAWKDADHPDLATPDDVAEWVSRSRREGDRVFQDD